MIIQKIIAASLVLMISAPCSMLSAEDSSPKGAVSDAASASESREEESWPIKGIRFVMDSYESGKEKTVLTAEYARLPRDGVTEVKEARIESYEEDGTVSSVITLARCHYDSPKQIIASESPVKLVQDGLLVTATGMQWSAKKKIFRLLKDVRIEYDQEKVEKSGLMKEFKSE